MHVQTKGLGENGRWGHKKGGGVQQREEGYTVVGGDYRVREERQGHGTACKGVQKGSGVGSKGEKGKDGYKEDRKRT